MVLAMSTWRFMGSYKWSYKSPNMGYCIVTLLISPHITTHEPSSRVIGLLSLL